jgi:hypothetical protein
MLAKRYLNQFIKNVGIEEIKKVENEVKYDSFKKCKITIRKNGFLEVEGISKNSSTNKSIFYKDLEMVIFANGFFNLANHKNKEIRTDLISNLK